MKMQKSMLQVINIVVQSINRLVEDKCVANSNHIRTQYFSASFLLLMKRPPDLPAGTKSLVSGKKLQNVLESQGKPSTYKWNYLKISNNQTNYFIFWWYLSNLINKSNYLPRHPLVRERAVRIRKWHTERRMPRRGRQSSKMQGTQRTPVSCSQLESPFL